MKYGSVKISNIKQKTEIRQHQLGRMAHFLPPVTFSVFEFALRIDRDSSLFLPSLSHCWNFDETRYFQEGWLELFIEKINLMQQDCDFQKHKGFRT